MTYFTDTFRTPFGLFSTAVNNHGALVATAFGTLDDLLRRTRVCHPRDDKSAGRNIREQILAYCDSQRRDFTIPLAAEGTDFQQRVWSLLREIPFGETRTYGQLAEQLGNPAASRAVGRANATNPICLIVPCHRVIGADGSLTGFAFGEDIKRRLLQHEKTAQARAA